MSKLLKPLITGSSCAKANCSLTVARTSKYFCHQHQQLWASSKPRVFSKIERDCIVTYCHYCQQQVSEVLLHGTLTSTESTLDAIRKAITKDHATCPTVYHFGVSTLAELGKAVASARSRKS